MPWDSKIHSAYSARFDTSHRRSSRTGQRDSLSHHRKKEHHRKRKNAVRFVVEFLVVTTLTGALIGWWVTRTRRGTVAVAVAAFAFTIGPGHNLPFFHIVTVPAATQTGLLLTLIPIVVASASFVAIDALLSRGETHS